MSINRDEYLNLVTSEYDRLAEETRALSFAEPVAYVYRPLDYARAAHLLYLHRFLSYTPRVIFLGMNPGPFGMAQTGIPFGEVGHVRDWLGIQEGVEPPKTVHPKKPIHGFSCHRSEVSGRRLWELFRKRFENPEQFFREYFVMNYCPLLFLSSTGANLAPVQLQLKDQRVITAICDQSLRRLMVLMRPVHLVGIGKYAAQRAGIALKDLSAVHVSSILHPSPANPSANRDWAGCAERELMEQGIWNAVESE